MQTTEGRSGRQERYRGNDQDGRLHTAMENGNIPFK